MLYMQIYSSGILNIEKFGKKLEMEYKRDKRESITLKEEGVKFDLFQLEAEPGLFDMNIETESVKIRISDIDYDSLEKLKDVIEKVKK